MAPEPFRGRTNEPALVVFTAARIARRAGRRCRPSPSTPTRLRSGFSAGADDERARDIAAASARHASSASPAARGGMATATSSSTRSCPASRRRAGELSGWSPPKRAPARAAGATRARRRARASCATAWTPCTRELDAAEAVAVATPVFFATVPAVLKILFDRCQPYWARRYVLGEPRSRTQAPRGDAGGGRGRRPLRHDLRRDCRSRASSHVLGVSAETVFECVGPDAPSDIGHHPEALRAAERDRCRTRRAGARSALVAAARRIDAMGRFVRLPAGAIRRSSARSRNPCLRKLFVATCGFARAVFQG